jgi:hypothetical protein
MGLNAWADTPIDRHGTGECHAGAGAAVKEKEMAAG